MSSHRRLQRERQPTSMAERIELRRAADLRARAGHNAAKGFKFVTFADMALLLWLALFVFVLGVGLVGFGSEHGFAAFAFAFDGPPHAAYDGSGVDQCPPADALHMICQGTPMEREYVVGKASECLLGPAAVRRHAQSARVLGTSTASELLEVAESVVQSALGYEDAAAATSGVPVMSNAVCVKVCSGLAEKFGATSAARFRNVRRCGLQALQRLKRPIAHSPAYSALEWIVIRVVSELALATPFHLDILCGVLDTPIIWERARDLLQGLDRENDADGDQVCVPGQECSNKATALCSPSTWHACSNGTAAERAEAARMQTRTALVAEDAALAEVIHLLTERTSTDGISKMLALMLDSTPDSSSYTPLITDIGAGMRAGKPLLEITQALLPQHATMVQDCKSRGVCGQRVREEVDSSFREVLLRSADEGALHGYAWVVLNEGGSMRLRSILMDSREFVDTCKAPGRPSCAHALSRADALYSDVLSRAADSAGRMQYARQIALGERSEAQLRHELEQSHEFLTGGGPARKAVGSVERLRRYYTECGGENGVIQGGGKGDVPGQNFSHPYWRGRWCDRRGCDDAGVSSCAFWPMTLYHMTLASVWGAAPEEWLLRKDGTGRVVGVEEEAVGGFAAALGEMSRVYVDLLGRFPDVGALFSRSQRLGEATLRDSQDALPILKEFAHELAQSGERAENLAVCTAPLELEKWREKALLLVRLLARYQVPLPAAVVECFVDGKMLEGSGMCGSVGKVVKALQLQWNAMAPLLGKGKRRGKCVTPLAMYVHERPHYFRKVVRALKRAEGIGDVCVLAVSLDSVHQEMIDIVLDIEFAHVRMLFRPVRDDLLKMQPVVAIKKHWLWLQDEIWTRMPETKNYEGHFALLEEDHIVTPDYLKVLQKLIELSLKHCAACWGVTVRWACMHDDDKDVAKLCRSHSVINTGIAFDRSTYKAIKSSDFEAFSDGWDWSLFHLAQTGQMGDMMLGPAVSRISNIGTVGATVTEHGDAHLQKQLKYNNVGDEGKSLQGRNSQN